MAAARPSWGRAAAWANPLIERFVGDLFVASDLLDGYVGAPDGHPGVEMVVSEELPCVLEGVGGLGGGWCGPVCDAGRCQLGRLAAPRAMSATSVAVPGPATRLTLRPIAGEEGFVIHHQSCYPSPQ